MKCFDRPFVLVILDGWGISSRKDSNPITLAKKPTLDRLYSMFPHTELAASGSAVGLRDGQEGNSEAGHLNIGAGRVVLQDGQRITASIEDTTFFRNSAFEQAIRHTEHHASVLHIVGLLSGVHSGHSQPEHIQGLLKLARDRKVKNIFLHLFTDGRDTPKFSAMGLLDAFVATLRPNERIATIMGRLYGMDRKKNWNHTERAYDTLVLGTGLFASSAADAIREAYARGESDEFITPTVIVDSAGSPIRTIQDNDSIIFFNLRSDRARQLTKTFVQKDFTMLNPGSFLRKKVLTGLTFVAMTDFGPDLSDILTAFPSPDLDQTFPMVMRDCMQLYIAESEKYAHITYFFNGGHANPVGNEQRVLVSSPKVEHYDEEPAMASYGITDVVVSNLEHDIYDVTVINYAAPDMIGHTGSLKSAITAVEVIDECIGDIVRVVSEKQGIVVITADHGNIESMINLTTGDVDTEHSTNPVPLIIADTLGKQKFSLASGGKLADVAPTILELLGREKPEEMTGRSLLVWEKSPEGFQELKED